MKRRYWIAGSVAVIVAGALAAFFPARYHAWQVDHSLTNTHITYNHFRCTAAPCPAWQLDLFGDGTVIYQGVDDVAVRGAYIYHIPRETAQAYIQDFRISGFWQKPHGGLPSPAAGGGCNVGIAFDRVIHRTGCLDITGDDGLTLGTPQLSADVSQLEALTQVDALVKGRATPGVTPSPDPVEAMRPYHRGPLVPSVTPATPLQPIASGK